VRNMSDSGYPLAACAESIDFAALLKRCMGRVELMARILSRFRIVVTQEISLLTQALELADYATISASTHRLKGTCLTASANSLAQLAEQVHHLSCQHQSVDCVEFRAALEAELAAVLASINDWELGAQRESN
jgi:HPt (histidine-containing phosphotransfer) domain-containing protein